MKPQITMSDFFRLPEVEAAIANQKRNPYGSPEHRAAFIAIVEIAKRFGVESYFPNEY